VSLSARPASDPSSRPETRPHNLKPRLNVMTRLASIPLASLNRRQCRRVDPPDRCSPRRDEQEFVDPGVLVCPHATAQIVGASRRSLRDGFRPVPEQGVVRPKVLQRLLGVLVAQREVRERGDAGDAGAVEDRVGPSELLGRAGRVLGCSSPDRVAAISIERLAGRRSGAGLRTSSAPVRSAPVERRGGRSPGAGRLATRRAAPRAADRGDGRGRGTRPLKPRSHRVAFRRLPRA
jgi:hypothetical protein